MEGNKALILEEVERYYSGKIEEFGATARGVDWNGEESQQLRFLQLCKLIDGIGCFSVNDIGCGYGALYGFLKTRYREFNYRGQDISAGMVAAARRCYGEEPNARFAVAAEPLGAADFSVASGIFNVRLTRPSQEWRAHIEDTLEMMNRFSRRGFAFNCLTSYSDRDRMRNDLYYADPCRLFDLCKRRFSRQVALLHDYGLYEFTILVRKQL